MLRLVIVLLAYGRGFVLSRYRLGLENVALRQQLAVLKRRRPRPRLHRLDRLFWVALRQLWPDWSSVLLVVQPETVVSWHRAGFRLFWCWRSRRRQLGRPPNQQRSSTTDPAPEGGQPELGCSAHSW